MAKIKVGIIGTGSISNEHIKAYLANPNVDLCAFCDIDGEKVEKMGKQYGVKNCYTDLDEMLKNENLDAVSVCTWNSQHAPCTIKALNAGCNVLCEKPMATSAKEAEMMQEAAEKNNKLLMIGFVRRFGNDCDIVEDFIDQSYFGELYYAKATYLRRHGCPGGWFGDKSRSGGGPLIDLGVHVIDLSRYLMGNHKPVSVYGATFHKLSNRPDIKKNAGYSASTTGNKDIFDVEDLATAMIRFDNGSVISIEASFSLNIKEDTGIIELFGTKAGAKLNPELELYSTEGKYMTNTSLHGSTALSFSGLFENEIDHYVACLTEGIPCKAPAEDGVTLMKILDGIYESARTGHEVIL